MNTFILFTDLDGTLLDGRTYSFEKAKPALEAIQRLRIPLVFVSSKTRGEIEVYRKLFYRNAHRAGIHPGPFFLS